MKNVVRTLLFFAPIAVVFFGCNSTVGVSGEIIGHSFLSAQDGSLLTNHSGITVSVEGQNISTTTDSLGQWSLTGLTTGSYNIDISKAGYGLIKILDFQLAGGEGSAGPTYLEPIPLFYVINLSDSISNGNIFVKGTLAGSLDTTQKNVGLFFAKNSSVSYDPKNYLVQTGFIVNATPFTRNLNSTGISLLQEAGFTSGQTVYMVAYGESVSPVGYTDPTTGKAVFTSTNTTASNVVSFVMP